MCLPVRALAQSYYQDVCGGQGGVTQVPLRDRYAPRWSDAPDLADAYIYREYVNRTDQVGLSYSSGTWQEGQG